MIRRAFLSFVASSTLAATAPQQGNVLVTGGHPGDPEYGCGGTISKLARSGYGVTILYLNRSEKGCGPSSGGCAALRTTEAETACRILGAVPRFAGQIDGEAKIDPAAYDAFAAIVHFCKPERIYTHWPIDNHRDHRATAMLAFDAWRKIKARCELFYYEVTDGEDTVMFTPTEYVDITAEEHRKRQACYAHASQSPDRFYRIQSRIAKLRGSQCGCAEAEGFIRQTAL